MLAMGLLGCMRDPLAIPAIPPTVPPTAAIVQTPQALEALPTPPDAPLELDPLNDDFSDYQMLASSPKAIEPPAMTTPQEAALAVVRIRGCNAAGSCTNTNQGSGAIIHPSGIILTAWHVTVLDPKNQASPEFYDHFLIEITDDASESPQPRYYARWSAYNIQDDLALLRVKGEFGQSQENWEQPIVDLPWLPISNSEIPIQPDILVMGYSSAARTVNFPSYRFSGLEGGEIKVPDAISKGFSGGPTLVQNDDGYEIIGVVSSRVQEETLISNVQQLENLIWLPKEQMWVENAQIVPVVLEGKLQSQLEVTVHTLGYSATAFDPLAALLLISDDQGNKARQRLQATNFVNIQQLNILIEPNSKLFNQPLFISIFDLAEGEVWRLEEWVKPEVIEPEATSTPTAVNTPTPTATTPPDIPAPTLTAAARATRIAMGVATARAAQPTTPTDTPDLDQTATADVREIDLAVAATLTAKAPTPVTVSLTTSVPTINSTVTQAQKSSPTGTPTISLTPKSSLTQAEESYSIIDDFNESLKPEWDIESGIWHVNNDRLELLGYEDKKAFISIGSLASKDYTISFEAGGFEKFRFGDLFPEIGENPPARSLIVIVRAKRDKSNEFQGGFFGFNRYRYQCGSYYDGSLHNSQEGPQLFGWQGPYDVRITIEDNTYVFYLNDDRVCTFQSDRFAEGQVLLIGTDGEGNMTWIDNFALTIQD